MHLHQMFHLYYLTGDRYSDYPYFTNAESRAQTSSNLPGFKELVNGRDGT